MDDEVNDDAIKPPSHTHFLDVGGRFLSDDVNVFNEDEIHDLYFRFNANFHHESCELVSNFLADEPIFILINDDFNDVHFIFIPS